MQTVKLFSEYVTEKIKEYLPEKYRDAGFRLRERTGNNGVLRTGVGVSPPGEGVERTVYMDPFFAEFQGGKPLAEIMRDIAVQMQGDPEIEKLAEGIRIADYGNMKPNLMVCLVNTGANRQKLFHMSHVDMEGLSMVCRFSVFGTRERGSVEVTDAILNTWGITKEKLFEEALRNMEKPKGYVLQEITDKAGELFGGARCRRTCWMPKRLRCRI